MKEWADVVGFISLPRENAQSAVGGHIPHADIHDALKDCTSPGIYVWGAWAGPNARLQYIGRCSGPICERFQKQRYFDEWRRAEIYELNLRGLPENFSWRESKQTRERRYIECGIPEFEVRGNGSGRVQRAERYAKIGLDNLWYYFIPTDDPTGCPELEKHLIQATSALLFRQWKAGLRRAFPLLNKIHIRRSNPYAPTDDPAFDRWLDGEWWAGATWHCEQPRLS